MRYALGIDYGTQSGRVILLDLDSAEEAAVSVVPYRHGVIDTMLPGTETHLPPDWALQNPLDYIEVIERGIPDVIERSGVDPSHIVGLGIDFTSCTVLPVTSDGTPLCTLPAWKSRPHAWPKLWKHHAAQHIADRINQVAQERGEDFLKRYGGRISSEWYFPKLIQIFEEDREIYEACSAFIEAADWIVWHLTGQEKRNSCTAGYKAMWSEVDGIPDSTFFESVHPEFTNPWDKLGQTFYPLGSKAGTLRADLAARLGLSPDTAVAVGNVDAMVSAPSAGMNGPGSLLMVMGTSICHLTISDCEVRLPGITGVVKDGIIPGMYGYEAGQAAVGDMFEWFIKKAVPSKYFEAAHERGVSIYEMLEEQAEHLLPGQNGLVALDWWLGNRSILGDADLSGMLVGMTLATTPEEIYRALLESTAFGTRRIVDNFIENGIDLNQLVACGGLAHKSPLLMQIYADVSGLPVIVRNSMEIPARGSAIFGAVAAGKSAGGFDSIQEASKHLAAPIVKTYHPDAERHMMYDKIYQVYLEIYSFFGDTHADLMHRLKSFRVNARR